MQKRYLVTPGPTPVPPEVWRAMSGPMVHHRGPDFQEVLGRVLARLPAVFQTENDILFFASSGTGAMEAAVANLCSPGDRVLVASAGYFGERWAAIASAYRLEVEHLRYRWGELLQPDEVGERLDAAGDTRAVYVTHSETSTGVVNDVQAIAEQVAGRDGLLVVDAVSSLGAVPLETDAWGIDVVVSGSQKALMTPPGLALCSVSARAWELSTAALSPRYALDWGRAKSLAQTPAVTLVQGLDAAVDLLLARGLRAHHEHHLRLGRAARAGAKAMGLELFSPDDDRSAVVTAIRVPEGIDGVAVVRAMRDRSGVTAAGGQGELKGRIVRIGHIGYVDVWDVVAALAALELALVAAGAEVERGIATAAALDAFNEAVHA
jgi:aspartate aminotransferase-like enzyme